MNVGRAMGYVAWAVLVLAVVWVLMDANLKLLRASHAATRVRQNQQVVELRAECEALGGWVTLAYRYDEERWEVKECNFP